MGASMITAQKFRADFPEFCDAEVYLNSQVDYYIKLAYLMLNPSRWGNTIDFGAGLFIAHNISLEARAQATAENGGIPGEQTGPVSSKSVDKVSISYDTGSGVQPGAGHWNLTIYGTRFTRLARMMGSGPIQVGIGVAPTGSGSAWSGPIVTPGFSNFG
jgi:hypothetical protein